MLRFCFVKLHFLRSRAVTFLCQSKAKILLCLWLSNLAASVGLGLKNRVRAKFRSKFQAHAELKDLFKRT